MHEMKIAMENIFSRVELMEDTISKLEDSNFEITQTEQEKLKRVKKVIYEVSSKEQILEKSIY